MNALERRQAILELLCERRFEKMENLAFEFSVHECTIRRDIQELSLSYPLYTKTGTYGGVYVMDGFNLRTKYLNIKQKELLEKFDDCYGEFTDISEREVFVYAFRLGARVAIEVLYPDLIEG